MNSVHKWGKHELIHTSRSDMNKSVFHGDDLDDDDEDDEGDDVVNIFNQLLDPTDDDDEGNTNPSHQISSIFQENLDLLRSVTAHHLSLVRSFIVSDTKCSTRHLNDVLRVFISVALHNRSRECLEFWRGEMEEDGGLLRHLICHLHTSSSYLTLLEYVLSQPDLNKRAKQYFQISGVFPQLLHLLSLNGDIRSEMSCDLLIHLVESRRSAVMPQNNNNNEEEDFTDCIASSLDYPDVIITPICHQCSATSLRVQHERRFIKILSAYAAPACDIDSPNVHCLHRSLLHSFSKSLCTFAKLTALIKRDTTPRDVRLDSTYLVANILHLIAQHEDEDSLFTTEIISQLTTSNLIACLMSQLDDDNVCHNDLYLISVFYFLRVALNHSKYILCHLLVVENRLLTWIVKMWGKGRADSSLKPSLSSIKTSTRSPKIHQKVLNKPPLKSDKEYVIHLSSLVSDVLRHDLLINFLESYSEEEQDEWNKFICNDYEKYLNDKVNAKKSFTFYNDQRSDTVSGVADPDAVSQEEEDYEEFQRSALLPSLPSSFLDVEADEMGKRQDNVRILDDMLDDLSSTFASVSLQSFPPQPYIDKDINIGEESGGSSPGNM